MKKLSLQWRLTLMTAALVTIVCLLLNLFISYSAIIRIDEIEDYVLEITPNGQEHLIIGLDNLGLSDAISEQIGQARHTFHLQSILATLAVILIGSTCTYFIAGRVLTPLRQFSNHIEKIRAQNLSEPLKTPDTEDEIARLTRSFNEMLERLNQAFTSQRQFSANAAHELRTPLAVMQTHLDVLRKRESPTIAEYDKTIRMLSEQTERLSHLVSILLEMTELQTVQRTDHISLSAVIEEVFCDLTQIADERSITLIQKSGDAMVIGSDPLLYRAIYNLVENAIKYNRPDGNVTVRIKEEYDTVIVSVTDTGTGINKENWTKIFEPFVRVDKSRSRAMGGAGLGLALVRDIAKQHGGSVEVTQSSIQGTTITLTLPAAAAIH